MKQVLKFMNDLLSRPTSRTILMLDLLPDAVVLQILTRSELGAERVSDAVYLVPPAKLCDQGVVLMPELLGEWLRVHLHDQEPFSEQIDSVYVVLDNAFVTEKEIKLPIHMSDEDIAFQLLAEARSGLPVNAPEICLDYAPVFSKTHQMFQVRSVAKSHVEAAARLAKGFGASLGGVLMHEELSASQTSSTWQVPRFNFMPHRALARQAKRSRFAVMLGQFAVAGVVSAIGLSVALAHLAQVKTAEMHDAGEAAYVAEAYSETRQAYEDVLKAQQRDVVQARGLEERLRLQQQTLQWSQVLVQKTDGIWILKVEQQGAKWSVQGEALSAAHAKQLLQQLQALPVWGRSPEMSSLDVSPGAPMWQFRMDADLKAII